jgi:hypothetical protein
MWYYCSDGFENFSELIKHLCTGHNKNEIKYREKELNFSNGKTGYRTKAYQDVIPDNCTITVTNDDRLSILNSERSKKKKTNTQKRTDNLYKQDEIGYQSKKSLLEMLDQMEIAHEKVKMTMIQMISNIW